MLSLHIHTLVHRQFMFKSAPIQHQPVLTRVERRALGYSCFLGNLNKPISFSLSGFLCMSEEEASSVLPQCTDSSSRTEPAAPCALYEDYVTTESNASHLSAV